MLKKNVCSLTVSCEILHVYIKYRLLNVWFSSSVSSLVFHLINDQPQKEVRWKFPPWWEICQFLPVWSIFLFVVLGLLLHTCKLRISLFSGWMKLLNHFGIIFNFLNNFINHSFILCTDNSDIYSPWGF